MEEVIMLPARFQAALYEDNGSFGENVASMLTAREEELRLLICNTVSRGEVIPEQSVPRPAPYEKQRFGVFRIPIARNWEPVDISWFLSAIMRRTLVGLAEEIRNTSLGLRTDNLITMEGLHLLFGVTLMWQRRVGEEWIGEPIEQDELLKRPDICVYERVLMIQPAPLHAPLFH